MKLTEHIINQIGFVHMKNSYKPAYYILDIKLGGGNEKIILGKILEDDFYLYNECPGFMECIKKLETLKDLVSAISEQSFKLGENRRARLFQEAMKIC